MPRDPRHTVHEGRNIAWRAAWDTFGRRHWRWFVYGRLLVPALVAAGIAVPVVVAWRTIDPATIAVTMIVVGVVAAAAGAVVGLSATHMRRRLYGRSAPVPAAFVLIGMALIVIGAVVLA